MLEFERVRRWRWSATFVWVLASAVLLAAECEIPVVDVPASDLDAKVDVVDADPNPPDGKVLIIVAMFSAGKYVQLSGAAITANGTDLPLQALGYMARVTIPAGRAYSITHSRAGIVTTIANVQAPQRPVITAPAPGALVSRSAPVMITYVAGGGVEVSGSAVGHRAGSGRVSDGADEQPDDGSYGPLSPSGFDAGPGTLSLTRKLVTTPAPSGFRSVQVTYRVGNEVSVTWR